jgi:acetyltransferase-like isoleucine patch superfamily enzyme
MKRHFGVTIGAFSYGPCLNPGGLPVGTWVGNYCSFADGIKVFRRNHPIDRISQHPFFFNSALGLLEKDSIEADEMNPLTVGHDVWIGHGVIICPGCRRIGNSAIIGAGSVLVSDVPPFAIVGGVPGRVIRSRLPESLQHAWIESKWWLKAPSELAPEIANFVRPFNIAERLEK